MNLIHKKIISTTIRTLYYRQIGRDLEEAGELVRERGGAQRADLEGERSGGERVA